MQNKLQELEANQVQIISSIKPLVFKYRRYDWLVVFANKKWNVCKYAAFNEVMRVDSHGNVGIGSGGDIDNPVETNEAKVARSLETHSFDTLQAASAMHRICSSLQEIEDNFGVSNSPGFIGVLPAYKFHKPEPSQWQCKLFGCDTSTVLIPAQGNVPNWFWRKMQYLIFGNEWIKNES